MREDGAPPAPVASKPTAKVTAVAKKAAKPAPTEDPMEKPLVRATPVSEDAPIAVAAEADERPINAPVPSFTPSSPPLKAVAPSAPAFDEFGPGADAPEGEATTAAPGRLRRPLVSLASTAGFFSRRLGAFPVRVRR